MLSADSFQMYTISHVIQRLFIFDLTDGASGKLRTDMSFHLKSLMRPQYSVCILISYIICILIQL